MLAGMIAPRHRRGLALAAATAALLVGLALAGAPPALAATNRLQPLGPAPVECTTGISTGCTFNSWVATFALTPHLVNVGEKITGKVNVLAEHCGDVFTSPCMRSLGWPVIGKTLTHCPTGSTGGSCTYKATTATRGWTITCANIDALDGAESCDYYAVIAHKRAISGTVLTDDGKPAAGVAVSIKGHGGGTVSTDSQGDYYAVVNPGHYTVSLTGTTSSVSACSGQKTGSACKLDLSHSDGTASFTIVSHLEVTVKSYNGGDAGLSFDKPLETPAFLAPASEAGGAEACLSGCTNLQVTVTQPDGEAVPGAEVSASMKLLSPGRLAPYPSGQASDQGHLCQTSQPANCGQSVGGLKTDSLGQAQLLYWAPGLISTQKVKITATATAQCPECLGGQGTGEATHDLTVQPYLIYEHDTTLGRDSDVSRAFADWWKDDGFISASSLKKSGVEKVLSDALKALGRDADLPLTVAMEVHDLATHTGQEQAITQLFDEQMGLSPFGLASTSPQTPWMTGAYTELIGGKPGSVLVVFKYGKPGLVLRYGKQLQYPDLQEIMKLRVYEVSYCQQGAVCGPGGPTDGAPLKHPLSSVTVDGIHPYLYFFFEGQEPARLAYPQEPAELGHPFRDAFVIPYEPGYWMAEQQGLRAP